MPSSTTKYTETIPTHSFRPSNPRRVIQPLGGPSMTKQEFKEQCDINHIMAKYQLTGAIDHFAKWAPQYGDFSPCDYQEARELVTRAQQMFAELPSSIRNLTETPEGFLAFVQNPANAAKLKELGLVKDETPVPPPPSGAVKAS